MIDDAYATSTASAFRYNWTAFINFHLAHKLPLYPLNHMNVARYLTVYSQKVSAYATIMNVASAIKKFYQLSGYVLDLSHPIIDLLLKSCKRLKSQTAKPKSPIEPGHLVLIGYVINYNEPCEYMFYLALLIQFFCCLRISNLVPASANALKCIKHLKRSDITFTNDSMILCLPWSKTLQNKDNLFLLPVADVQNCILRPVKLYREFVTCFPMHPNMPAFSMIHNGKLFVLTQGMYSNFLKKFLQKIGVPPDNYGSHSVRRGAASFMFLSQVPISLLKQHGTWRSQAYTRYISFSHNQKLIPTQKMFAKINDMFGNQ